MTRFAGVVALLATICLLPAAGAGNSAAIALQNAAAAWERGDYTSALTTYQELLAGPDADGVLDSIALQTGELYQTTELTTDGSNPGISSDGKYATYETGAGATRVTRLVSLTSPAARAGTVAGGVTVAQIAELQGFGAVFSLDGSKLAYLKLSPSPALKAAFAELDRAPQAERNLRQSVVNAQSGLEAIITVRDLATGREEELKTDEMVKSSLVFGSADVIFFAGASLSGGSPQQVYTIAEGRAAAPVTAGPGDMTPAFANSTGDAVAITTRMAAGGRGGGGPRERKLQRAHSQRRQGHATEYDGSPLILRRRQDDGVCDARWRRLQADGRPGVEPWESFGRAEWSRAARSDCPLARRNARGLPDDDARRLGDLYVRA